MFESLRAPLAAALAKPAPETEKIVAACDALSKRLSEEIHVPLLMQLGMSREKALWELKEARRMMGAEFLRARIASEFGPGGIPGRREFAPYGANGTVLEEWRPLGVLLHVSAGNVDALPVFSVIEGLLTGNVNLLKLPAGDPGLSEGILEALCEEEPSLRERVYTFDIRSEDIESLKALASLADAVALYGSDEAVRAVRALAPPWVKLVEWGHRISFAYVSPDVNDAFLRGVARDMCFTAQLYCTSCQGVFVDAREEGEVYRLAERFLPILEAEARAHPSPADIFARAGASLALYAESLETGFDGTGKILRGKGCSVAAYPSFAFASSHMFGNCWVRPLPREEIIPCLRPYSGYLQTVALSCDERDRAYVENALFAAGAVRITDGFHMSEAYCGMPRDGMHPLSRYMKRTSVARFPRL